jgi:uncharacterized protein YdeI (YjbR/CyaY-like superfamily)
VASTARFFASPEKLRAWFTKHHGTFDEVLVGFHKKDTGKPSVTWPEAVDEALCLLVRTGASRFRTRADP